MTVTIVQSAVSVAVQPVTTGVTVTTPAVTSVPTGTGVAVTVQPVARSVVVTQPSVAATIDQTSIAVDVRPGISDHGLLSGLADDDHTQYHNNARGDARYSQLGHTHLSGSEDVLAKTAGQVLAGHRAVWIDSDGLAYYADSSTVSASRVSGITTGAALQSATAYVQYAGEITEPSWNWSPGPVYLGASGTLTQTPPTTGAVCVVGIATAPTLLLIRPYPPIFV